MSMCPAPPPEAGGGGDDDAPPHPSPPPPRPPSPPPSTSPRGRRGRSTRRSIAVPARSGGPGGGASSTTTDPDGDGDGGGGGRPPSPLSSSAPGRRTRRFGGGFGGRGADGGGDGDAGPPPSFARAPPRSPGPPLSSSQRYSDLLRTRREQSTRAFPAPASGLSTSQSSRRNRINVARTAAALDASDCSDRSRVPAAPAFAPMAPDASPPAAGFARHPSAYSSAAAPSSSRGLSSARASSRRASAAPSSRRLSTNPSARLSATERRAMLALSAHGRRGSLRNVSGFVPPPPPPPLPPPQDETPGTTPGAEPADDADEATPVGDGRDDDGSPSVDPTANSVRWDAIFAELEHIEEDGHFEDRHSGGGLPWYSPLVQRQRWDEEQVLPHVNWGDLFFDLFYVAAAYNLGAQLVGDLSSDVAGPLRSAVYFVGAFGPLWRMWETSMFHESRYTCVDYAHRAFEVVRYLCVGTAILHVKPIELQMDPKSAETLVFALAALGEGVMHLALCGETYARGLGDRTAIRNHTAGKVKYLHGPVLAMYLAASVTATVLYVRPEEEDDEGPVRRSLASAEYESKSESEGSVPPWKLSDLPMTLMALAYLQYNLVTAWMKLGVARGRRANIKDHYVWPNIDYIVHRYGEWILLMIGEGILSLLIVETVEARDYYVVTTFGILTIIFIQILKFESEPSHAQGHAMWKNLQNGMCYSYLMQILSMSLIVFGATYKVFLKGVLYESKDAEKYADAEEGGKHERMLGAAYSATSEASDIVQAKYFSSSLAMVLVSLELMCLTHSGIQQAAGHLVWWENGKEAKPNWPVIIVALFKLGLVLFTITLWTWTTDPAVLTVIGCGVVMFLTVTRVAHFVFINKKSWIGEMRDKASSVLNSSRLSRSRRTDEGSTGEGLADEEARGTVSSVSNSEVKGEHGALIGRRCSNTQATQSSCHGNSSDEKCVSVLAHTDLGINESVRGTQKRVSVLGSPDLGMHGSGGDANSSFDGIVVADLNGIIKQVNDTAVHLFRYATDKEMIGKNLSILVGGGVRPHHDGYVKAFKKKVTTHENPAHEVLGRQRMLHGCRADGTEFPCIVGIKMVSNNTRIAGYIRDMSGVVSKEKQKVSDTMDAAIEKVVDDHAFDGIIATDNRGIIKRVNSTAVSELGYSDKDEMIGGELSVLVRGVAPDKLLDNQEGQRIVTLTRKDGTEFQSILASKKIKGTNTFASYIRNIEPIRNAMKSEKCD